MFLSLVSAVTEYTNFADLGLNPIALDLGIVSIKWYSLAYLAGIFLAYWLLLKMLKKPGAPMARRHVDDLLFYGMLGVILGGRLGYVLFYKPEMLKTPLEVLRIWDGGMSLHGGMLGVLVGIWYLVRKNGLSFLRVCDYVACTVPLGLLFGRLANFVNGELWGRTTDVPWAIIFPQAGPDPRHPSQLYEAGMEGVLMFALLTFLFWKTNARMKPGLLVGIASLWYGLSRFIIENFREPDAHLGIMPWGLTMGQTLTVPMVLIGIWLIFTSSKRTIAAPTTTQVTPPATPPSAPSA